MWPGFDRYSNSTKTEASSQNETIGDDGEHERISTIAGSLASIVTGHSESAVSVILVSF